VEEAVRVAPVNQIGALRRAAVSFELLVAFGR
jgi:hypothetical protein